MEGELIYVSVISLVGAIIITQLLSLNFYKRERFKFDLWKNKQLSNISIKQAQKAAGLPQKKVAPEINIPELIQTYLKNEEEPESENWVVDVIGRVAEEHPELVQELIGRFAGGTQKETNVQEMR